MLRCPVCNHELTSDDWYVHRHALRGKIHSNFTVDPGSIIVSYAWSGQTLIYEILPDGSMNYLCNVLNSLVSLDRVEKLLLLK